ncbi:MAG: hypothetical protein ACHQZS_12335, partial [Candidatus Binatales bacterium]
ASNSSRLGPGGKAVTEAIAGDDLEQQDYWRRFRPQPDDSLYDHGTPLHLVNVTINETLDGQSEIEQRDRKGIGMAIGPAGISAGISHHAVFNHRSQNQPFVVYPAEGCFRMFDYGAQFTGELLSLGNWTSISGAAVASGMGSRTSLGLSFLLGYFNVRLGYWWDSGVDPARRKTSTTRGISERLGRIFTWCFPVQSFLLDELVARFHGTARRWWYLTDGGHFENMGGYELIRRGLEMIVVIDAEADPDYTFEGLANLVRKARLDFETEIEFLSEERLNQKLPGELRKYFGTLEQLRRADEAALSGAYAALAEVHYKGGKKGRLLYIKPTLTGDEPADVERYHTENPSFPHETTAEQFFDEAQWESYRKLGEHIATLVFRAGVFGAGGAGFA